MRRSVCLFLLLVPAAVMHAQDGLDSLLRVLSGQRGAERVRTLGEVEWALSFTDPGRALAYGQEALKLAVALRDSALVAQAANDLAIPEYRLGHFASCIALNQRALSIRRALRDSTGIAASHSKLGVAFTEMLQLDSALYHNQQAEAIYAAQGDLVRLGTMRGNMARLYQQMGDIPSALKVARQTVSMLKGTGETYVYANGLGQLAQILVDVKQPDSAMFYARQALPLFESVDDRAAIASLSNVMGICARERGDNTAALEHYQRALRMAGDVGDQEGVATYLSNVANVLRDLGRLEDACIRYDSAIALCAQHGFADQHLSALLGKVDALTRKGDMAGAFRAQQAYQVLKDSAYKRERIEALSDMQVRYETERTERELAQERELVLQQEARIARQRLTIGGVVLAGLLLGALAWAFIVRQRSRARAERDAAVIAEREQGLRTAVERMDEDRRRIAAELHDGVGQQLTGIKYRLEAAAADRPELKEVLAMADDAGREVRGIAHRMMPRALGELGLVPALADMLEKTLRLPGMRHSFEHFGLEQRLPQAVEVGVYRIAQELVNNIIKHARATAVQVQLLRNKGTLVLIVEDDGVGLDPRRAGDGLGLRSLHDRARILHGTIAFGPGGERGTVATLRIPLNERPMP